MSPYSYKFEGFFNVVFEQQRKTVGSLSLVTRNDPILFDHFFIFVVLNINCKNSNFSNTYINLWSLSISERT